MNNLYGGTAAEMARLINDSGVLGKTTKVTAKTVNNVSFDKIIEAIHTIQTNLDISGISMEEYTELVESGAMSQEKAFELLGTSAKEGATTLQGSLAMTKSAWNNLLTGMADPNADFGQLMDNLIESGSAALGNITPIVERAFKSLGNFISKAAPIIAKRLPELVQQLLPDLVNTAYDLLMGLAEALPGLFPVLIDTAWQLFNEITDKISEKFPALEPVFDVLKSALSLIATVAESAGNGLKTIWDNFLSKVVGVTWDIFAGFLKGLADVLDRISKNKTAVDTLVTIVGSILGIVAAAKTLIGVITLVKTAIEAVSVAGGIANAVFAANPIGLIIVAIGALIAVIVEVITYWDELVWGFEFLVQRSSEGCELIKKWFSDMWNSIVDGYWWFIDRIVEGAQKIWNDVTGAFSKVGEFFGGLWNDIVSTFSDIGIKVGEAIGGAFKSAINAVIWTVEGALNAIPNTINGMLGAINAIPGVEISMIPTVTLPRLAQGGVLKKGQVGYLEGDGDEAVVPLSQNTEWIDKVADKISEKSDGNATYNFYFNFDNISGNKEDMEENAELFMNIFAEKMSRRERVFG